MATTMGAIMRAGGCISLGLFLGQASAAPVAGAGATQEQVQALPEQGHRHENR